MRCRVTGSAGTRDPRASSISTATEAARPCVCKKLRARAGARRGSRCCACAGRAFASWLIAACRASPEIVWTTAVEAEPSTAVVGQDFAWRREARLRPSPPAASSLQRSFPPPPPPRRALDADIQAPQAQRPDALATANHQTPRPAAHPRRPVRRTKPPHGLHLPAPLRVDPAAWPPHSSFAAPRLRLQPIAAVARHPPQFSKIPLAERKAEDGTEGVQGSHGDGADGAKGRSMPGIVSMDRNGAQGAGLGKLDDRASAAPAAAQPKLNGDVPLPQLDGPSNMNGNSITNGAASLPQSPSTGLSQFPPELTSYHDFYLPFGKLVDRVAQETNVSLGEVLDKMSNLQISPAPAMNGINGHMTNGSAPQSKENEEKKTLMLNWAWGEREKFIKLLVLSKWSRNCDDVSKMIDLNMWLTEQMAHYEEAPKWIGQLKLNMEPAKAPNPDLRTALEVLSTGKTPWMPDVCLLFRTSQVA